MFGPTYLLHKRSNQQNTQQQQQRSSLVDQHQWVKPCMGHIKCNIDGAWFKNQTHSGLGICLKDHDEMYLKAKTMEFDVELDCKQVVDVVNGGPKLTNLGILFLVASSRDNKHISS